MFNIFLAMFFSTLAFAFVEPFFFIGYLISIALFGLFQAIFMANAGGAWDNAKKIVETELKMKGTELHAASIVGDTVGDPFKDTSSVAMNPVIKFTTLFGVLAVELGVYLAGGTEGSTLTAALAAVFFVDRHGVRVALVLRDADRSRRRRSVLCRVRQHTRDRIGSARYPIVRPRDGLQTDRMRRLLSSCGRDRGAWRARAADVVAERAPGALFVKSVSDCGVGR